ncbi:hypothetical protein ACVWW6_001345 [Bradyrhizobium sp. USDA 3311]
MLRAGEVRASEESRQAEELIWELAVHDERVALTQNIIGQASAHLGGVSGSAVTLVTYRQPDSIHARETAIMPRLAVACA